MKRLNHTEFIERIERQHGKEIKVLGEYKNKRTKVLVQHSCGHVWEANPEPLWNGHGCPKCANNLRKDTPQFKKEVYDVAGDEYEVLGEYVNTHTPILFRHNVCGAEFEMSPNAFLHQGQRCPSERYIRSAESNRLPLEEVKAHIKDLVGDEYAIIGGYQGSAKETTFIHHKCGRSFRMLPTRFINQGVRCPHCYLDQNRSDGEYVVVDYLKQKGVFYQEQYKMDGCRNVRPLRFDFAVFDTKHNLQLLIEYDGSQHFTPKFPNGAKNFERIQINDRIKNHYCRENDIPLLRIKHTRSSNSDTFRRKVIDKLDQAFSNIQ